MAKVCLGSVSTTNCLSFFCMPLLPNIRPHLSCGTGCPYSVFCIITVLQFHTSKNLLKLHDSLIVNDHNRLIEKETVLMMAALMNVFDLKS